MNKNKLFVTCIVAVMLLSMIVGCSNANTETKQPTPAPAIEITTTASATEPADAATVAPTDAPAISGVDEAKQLVGDLAKPVEFEAPGPAMNIGDTMKGKKIYFIANGINYQFVVNLLAGLNDGASKLGMEVVAVDGAGDVSKAATLVQQGIAQKADVIVIQSFPAEQLTAVLKEAKADGIPVVEMFGRDPQLPTAELKDMGVEGIVSFCYSCAGQQMAQYAVAESDGKVNAVVFNVPEIGTAALERDGFVTELARLSPTSTVKVVDAPLSQWSDQLPTLTSSVLQMDSSVNYLIPLYDSMVSLMKPQVYALGMESTVKIVTYNGTLEGLQSIQNKEIVSGDIGGMNHWVGYAAMDQILRILSGAGAVADEKVPHRLFDSSNIGTIDITKDETTWYGDVDLAAEYAVLWGVK